MSPKENKESPADMLKREMAEKAAAKAATEKVEVTKDTDVENKPAAETITDEQLAALEQGETATTTISGPAAGDLSAATDIWRSTEERSVLESQAKSAADKLTKMVQSIPMSTGNEHVLFGVAGVKFTAGDLRALTGMKRS